MTDIYLLTRILKVKFPEEAESKVKVGHKESWPGKKREA